MLPFALKKLFLYISPLNYVFGEYNAGAEYILNERWALDVNAAYIYEQEGGIVDRIYQDVFNSNKLLYQGPSIRIGAISFYENGVNPFRTDYNEVELLYRYLWYTNVDFTDDADTGKVFNISETMHVTGLSWMAGYELADNNNFHLDGYVGFGLQMRFRNIHINSYGFNFNSDEFLLNDTQHATRLVPMLNAGIRIGLKVLEVKPDD
jgi:hypothetical protein